MAGRRQPRVLLVQGANMMWLGRREPEIYGTTSARQLDAVLRAQARALRLRLDIFYSNVEGLAIDRIYQAAGADCEGIVMNPAGFMYAGYALRDCLLAVRLPYIEVHMTNIEKRGKHSVLADVARGVIAGLGVESYRLGLAAMAELLRAPR